MFTVMSAFSGGMGLDLGFHTEGFETVVAQEMAPAACETIRKNGYAVAQGSITDYLVPGELQESYAELAWKRFCELTGQERGTTLFPEVDVLVGGPPCQSFSLAGKRGGLSDERGQLVYAYLELARLINPRVIVMENVPSIASSTLEDGTPLMEDIRRILADMGYEMAHGVLNAADFGAPQTRNRRIMIASRTGTPALPVPTHDRNRARGRLPWVTLREAVAGLPSPMPGEYAKFNARQQEMMSFIGAGESWHAIYAHREAARQAGDAEREAFFDALGKKNMGVVWDRDFTGSTATWRRLSWDKPAPTLTTSPLQRRTFLAHPDEERALSVAEYARVQGFPDDWELCGSLAARYRQLGNAVPVQLGGAIARAIKPLLG